MIVDQRAAVDFEFKVVVGPHKPTYIADLQAILMCIVQYGLSTLDAQRSAIVPAKARVWRQSTSSRLSQPARDDEPTLGPLFNRLSALAAFVREDPQHDASCCI